jgi:hypothetical protein
MFNLPQMFDGMVAIDDSNWYIKRLNNMEIDKKKSVILGCYIKIIGWEDFDPPYTGRVVSFNFSVLTIHHLNTSSLSIF